MSESSVEASVRKSNGAENSGRHNRVDRPGFRNRDRPAPYHRGARSFGPRPSNSTRLPPFNRVFVQNIPYEQKWQNLKDLFRNSVGEVTYVELFTDDAGKSRGYGVVEFKSKELCEEAVKKMNRHEIDSRKILVKLDYDGDLCRKALLRDGHPAGLAMSGAPPIHSMPPPMPVPLGPLPPLPPPMAMGPPALRLPKLPPVGGGVVNKIQHSGPIGKTVFVANLDYKVTYNKLKEVFQLAGRVVNVDLMLDKDNKSRGMATITYDDPIEAAQAISMLNNQKLYDRTLIVKMDKDNLREKQGGGGPSGELPSGLSGIGPPINFHSRDPGPGYPPPSLGPSPGGFGDAGNGLGPITSRPPPGMPGLSGLSEFAKSEKLAAGLAALGRLSESLSGGSGGLDLGSLGALSNLGELSRLSSGATRNTLDERIMDERIRNLSQSSNVFSDRERIERLSTRRDIQRVDSRIRDIDRSLERGRGLGMNKDLPPMPPPMEAGKRMTGSSVFVKNLSYAVSWQELRDKFSRCGRVLFADIKTDNGKSRGCGSVRFESPDQAEAAVRHLNGMEIDGRRIVVHIDSMK